MDRELACGGKTDFNVILSSNLPLNLYIYMCVSAWAKVLIRYFGVFHDQPPCSIPRFRNPEKSLEGEESRVKSHTW